MLVTVLVPDFLGLCGKLYLFTNPYSWSYSGFRYHSWSQVLLSDSLTNPGLKL